MHSAYPIHQILLEAGFPKDVMQFLQGDAEEMTNTVLKRSEFAGISFVGSTQAIKEIQKKIGDVVGVDVLNLHPQIVGGTRSKGWGVAHA